MRHSLSLTGIGFALRPVTLDDGRFIIGLRTNPNLSRYINVTSANHSAQREWLEKYFLREGDFYFIIENLVTGKPEGTVSIYGLSPDGAIGEWGRWILRPGSFAAIESALLVYRIAFNQMNLSELYCHTVADNKRTVAFHTSCGLKTVRTLPGEFNIQGVAYDAVEQRLTRDLWPEIEARLTPLAVQAARLAARSANA